LRPRNRSLELPRRTEPTTRINDQIRASIVRLVGDAGEQLGVKPISEARAYASQEGLDLVEVAAQADPPVCRVMDYGKHRYQEEQKAKQARKKQTRVKLHTIRLRPKIAENDYTWKKKQLLRFLEEDSKVKLVLLFRGREREHPERGRLLLDRLAEDVGERGRVEMLPILEGRSMTMVIAPTASHSNQGDDGSAPAGPR
jgi:translation initiation factor IF-3